MSAPTSRLFYAKRKTRWKDADHQHIQLRWQLAPLPLVLRSPVCYLCDKIGISHAMDMVLNI